MIDSGGIPWGVLLFLDIDSTHTQINGGFSHGVQALWLRPPLPDMTSVCEWGHRPLCPRVVRRGARPRPGYNVAGRVPGSCAPTNQRGTAGDTCTVGYTYLTRKGWAVQAGRVTLGGGQSIIFAFKFSLFF